MFHDYSKTLLAQITATISPFVFSAPRPVAQALLIAQVASYQSRTIKCGILLSTDHSPDSLTSRIDGWSISPAFTDRPDRSITHNHLWCIKLWLPSSTGPRRHSRSPHNTGLRPLCPKLCPFFRFWKASAARKLSCEPFGKDRADIFVQQAWGFPRAVAWITTGC